MLLTYRNAIQSFSRSVRLTLFSMTLVGFCYMGIYVILFNLYLVRLGYGPEFVGLVNGLGFLAAAIASIPAGMLGSRLGSRRMMILGASLIVAGLGAVPLAELMMGGWRSATIITFNSIAWMGAVCYHVNVLPYLMGASSAQEWDHLFSLKEALVPLAAIIGSVVGGLLPGIFARLLGIPLTAPTPYGCALLVAAILFAPMIWAAVVAKDVAPTQTAMSVQATTGRFPLGVIATIALIVFLLMAGQRVALTFFNVYLDTRLYVPTAGIGILSAIAQLMAVCGALLTPTLIGRWGKEQTILIGAAGMSLTLLPLALIAHWGAAGFSYMGVTTLMAVTMPAISIYHQERVEPARRATMSGIVMMAASLSSAVMAFGGGFFAASMGYRSLFLMGAGLTGASALLFWLYISMPSWRWVRPTVPKVPAAS